jgi:hypothetical protein
MSLYMSPAVREKLLFKHSVTEVQVVQCFANQSRTTLIDNREQNRTTPPTEWFIAQTDYGIRLKVCFIFDDTTGVVEIKSAFPPNAEEERIYNKYSRSLV